MVKPTKALRETFRQIPEGREWRKKYYAGNDTFRRCMNYIANASTAQLEWLQKELEEDLMVYIARIREAHETLGIKNPYDVAVSARLISEGRVRVEVDGEYFGIWDVQRETFVD